jgi:hypothetical protein
MLGLLINSPSQGNIIYICILYIYDDYDYDYVNYDVDDDVNNDDYGRCEEKVTSFIINLSLSLSLPHHCCISILRCLQMLQ